MAIDTRRLKVLALLAVTILASYGYSLRTRAFVYDDTDIIERNPFLLQGAKGLMPLLSTGYWEAPLGSGASVQEYRPVLMLSFWAQALVSGLSARAMRLANILLHLLVCWLLWEILRKKMGLQAAFAGALIYSVMPIHSEAVGLLTGRSEVLSTALLLGSWLALEKETPIDLVSGLSLYAAALLTKESSIMFPIFIALNDWVFLERKAWQGWSRATQIGLWLTTVAALTPRWLVLSTPFHGGAPYFRDGHLVAALTFSKFALEHYLRPSLTGTGLCSDFSRPLIADAQLSSVMAWLILLAWTAFFLSAAWSLARKKNRWAFWILGPCLFLLPTSNLIMPLDTLGAERFLYFPTISLAAAWGFLYQKAQPLAPRACRAALIVLCAAYGFLLSRRNQIWNSTLDFEQAAVACNPVSAKSWDGLGAALIANGDLARGVADLKRAAQMDPALSSPYYNMARLEYSRGKFARAEFFLTRLMRPNPESVDVWILLGLCAEKEKKPRQALSDFNMAARVDPQNPLAQFNAGRLCLILSDIGCAQERWGNFLRLAPQDPQAPAVRAWLSRLDYRMKGNPQGSR